LVKAFERAALAGVLILLFGGAYLTPRLVLPKDVPVVATPASATDPRRVAAERHEEREAGEPGDGFTDVYGNEINDAVATYTLDPSGSLYELHSPQTELPRLGIPKS
jgi:hypothetical protein